MRRTAGKILTPKQRPRTCDRCGRTYGRRNLVEGWGEQNPGHRAGWIKTTLRICTKCGSANTARRLLIVASVVPRSTP